MSDSIKGLKYRADRLLMKLGMLRKADRAPVKLVFIVSTGRTGTKFLARFFNRYNGVWALHEPKPDFLIEGIRYAAGKISTDKASAVICRNRRAIRREALRRGANIYIESNNRLFSLLKPLRKSFSGVRIIHIVRDGRDYVRSGMSRRWYKKKDRTPRLKAIMFPADPYYKSWNEMSRFEKITWRWQKKDGFIYDDIKAIPDSLTVKFEDIFEDRNFSGLKKIAEYTGLDKEYTESLIAELIDNKVNSTGKYAIKDWHHWNDTKKEKFYTVAGNHMKRYGYR